MNIVEKLSDYWQLKGLLMKVKFQPKIVQEETYQQKFISYIRKYSNFEGFGFWHYLNPDQRKEAVQYIRLQEFDNKTLVIKSNRDSAMVYVLINGQITLKTNGDTHTLSAGTTFGFVDLFNEVMEIHRWRRKDTKEPALKDLELNEENDHIIMNFHKATVICLSLPDYYNNVLLEQDKNGVQDEILMREEFSNISGLAWDELTDDDKFYVRVYITARSRFPKNVFDCLNNFKIVPVNARVPAYKYFKSNSYGSHIILKKDIECPMIIVIKGSFRVDIVMNKSSVSNQGSKIILHRHSSDDGRGNMAVSKKSMSLIRIDAGGILLPTPDVFEVFANRVKAEKEARFIASGKTNNVFEENISKEKKELIRNKILAKYADHVFEEDDDINEEPYHLKLTFDQSTDYLCIPSSLIDSILNDKVMLKDMAKGMFNFMGIFFLFVTYPYQ